MKYSLIKASILLVVSLLPAEVLASVIINEISWMGTKESYNNEWIELFNNTDSPLGLDHWSLKTTDGTPKINLAGTIPSLGYYLLERTDDNTVPNITADQIYIGVLNNNGEYLKLFDSQNNLIDEVNCVQGWFEGDNSAKQTMERKSPQLPGNNPENWQTSQNPGGTPRAKNSIIVQIATEVESTQETEQGIKQEPELKTYPSGIIFTEILPSPEGPDAEEEWIEIFNKNGYPVDLSGWHISDTVGVTNSYTFPEGLKIEGGGFLVFLREETKITLNNSGDSLKIVSPDNKVTDSIAYEKAPCGKSYSLIGPSWEWGDVLTPGNLNISKEPPLSEAEVKETVRNGLDEDLDIKEDTAKTIKLATAEKNIPDKDPSFFYVFLIALALAMFFGMVTLLLRKGFRNLIS